MSRRRDTPAMVRTRQNDTKAADTLRELLEAGRLSGAAVILRYGRPAMEILGFGLTPWQLGRVLVGALEQLATNVEQKIRPLREAHIEPDSVGETVGVTTPGQAITTAPDGTLLPPKGETIISCGVCRHPRYYVTVSEADELPVRLSCAHCGNEIVLHRLRHQGGRA